MHAPNPQSREAPRRDETLGRRWLRKIATTPDYREAVLRRLEAGDREYHDSALSRPLVSLLDELDEEAVDLAGWSILAGQVNSDPAVHATLVRIAQLGAIAHAEIGRARRTLAADTSPAA